MTDHQDFRSSDHLAQRLSFREGQDAEREKKLDGLVGTVEEIKKELGDFRVQIAKILEGWRITVWLTSGGVSIAASMAVAWIFHR